MKVQLSLIFCILFLGCSQAKPISMPTAGSPDDGDQTADDSTIYGSDPTLGDDSDSRPPVVGSNSEDDPATGAGLPPVIGPELVTEEFPGAHSAAATLVSFYKKDTGLWPDGWWPSANALTAIIDYMILSGSREYLHILNNTYEKNKAADYINEYFDESAWWGLAWLRAYDLSKDTKYLEAAKRIEAFMMTKGWDEKCGGGIYWKTNHGSKNAVENELYIKLAAGLHNRIPGDTAYLANAQKAWNWFLASGLINKDNLVNDALTSECKNNNEVTWSYNQGIILGAIAELYQATGDNAILSKGKDLALASAKSLATTENVIKERNDPGCGSCMGNERVFKGAYVRGLREINQIIKNATLNDYLDKSAKAAWTKARSTFDVIGFRWEGPFDSDDSSRQSSAVDLFNSRIPVKARTNLVFKKAISGPAPCGTNEAPEALVDGSATTKFCSSNTGGSTLTIDTGALQVISVIRLLHAGAGGENKAWNTLDFELSISDTATGSFTEVDKVRGNKSNGTVHSVNKSGRYIRLHITNGGSDNVVRIYELAAE